MGRSSNISFLIFFLFINNTNYTTKVVQGDEDFIHKTCKNTQYIDLCISSLKSNPSSSNSDLKGLGTIMVKIGIVNASETYAYLSSQHSQVPKISGTITSDATTMKNNVYKLCASKYSYANDSLKSTLQDLSLENYDYASMHVMAASDYPNACHNAFNRNRGMDYPTVLKVREDGFKHICAVVLGIVDQLYSIDNHKSL